VAAIVVGLAQGFINGILDTYMANFCKYQTGHVRVTTQEYKKRERFMPVDELILNSEEVKEKIKKIPNVKAVRERIRFGILLAKDNNTKEAVGMGIDLNNNEFDLKKKLKKGTIVEDGLYIGSGLAKKMNIKLGDKLLLATKTSEGGLNGIKLKVAGIFHFGMMFDRNFFFMGLGSAKKLLKMTNATTELYIFGKDISNIDAFEKNIQKTVEQYYIAESFKKQLGPLYVTFNSMKYIYGFIEAMILFLASFVIINTMMMAIFERMREIGTLKAMGMTDRQLFINFTYEGAIMGAIGGVTGGIIGFLIVVYFSKTGINMATQIANLDMPIEYIIKPAVEFVDLIAALIICIVVPSIAAMIPARHARKLTPVEALKN